MDLSASQYSSASESGWTSYIDQTSLLEKYFQKRGSTGEYEGKGARLEEEGLSMVSDASSGPPHYHDEVDKYSSHSSTSLPKKKVKECGPRNLQQASLLDDTASSPVYSFSPLAHKKVSLSGKGAAENAMALSQSFSATEVNAKPKFKKHFNFLECSSADKQSSEDQGDTLSGDSKQKDENQT